MEQKVIGNIKQANNVQFKREFYNVILVDPDRSQVLAEELKAFFSDPAVNEAQYRWTYFLWYTELVWKRLTSFSHDVVVAAVGSQVPMAILQDVKVINELLTYLNARTVDAAAMEKLDSEMRTAFRNAKSSLEELLKDAALADNSQVDISTATERYKEVVDFFSQTEPGDIGAVVDGFIFPEHIKPMVGKEENNPTPFALIRQNSIAIFAINENGQFEHPESVIKYLEGLSTNYHDPKILDLYYFDQTDNQFHWNEELIDDVRNTKATKITK